MFGIAFVDWRARSVRVLGVLSFATGIAVVTAPALVHGWRTWGRPMIADSSVYNVWVGLTDTERRPARSSDSSRAGVRAMPLVTIPHA